MNILIKAIIDSKFFLFFLNFLSSTKSKFTKSSLIGFDKINLKVFILIRGARIISSFDLSTIIFDNQLISNLKAYDAAIIGYNYGLTYFNMNLSKHTFDYNIHIREEKYFRIQSIDRNKLITFSSNSRFIIKKMYPCEIIKNTRIISNFHPIHACYIGILGGLNSHPKLNFSKP